MISHPGHCLRDHRFGIVGRNRSLTTRSRRTRMCGDGRRPRPFHAALAMMVWLLSGAGLLPCVLACRPHSAAPPAPPRSAVQLLIQAAPVINPGHHGEPWPTALTIYQLRGDPEAPDHEPFDLAILEARGDAAFGELLVSKRDYTAFPDTRARLVVPPRPRGHTPRRRRSLPRAPRRRRPADIPRPGHPLRRPLLLPRPRAQRARRRRVPAPRLRPDRLRHPLPGPRPACPRGHPTPRPDRARPVARITVARITVARITVTRITVTRITVARITVALTPSRESPSRESPSP
jgi:type VI secretion system VasD/TssJ family lipoprotein